MRLNFLLSAFALTLVSALGLSAQSVRVIFVTGQAEIQSPAETNLRPVTKGEIVTLGTRIVTGTDGRVALTPMPGVKSLISPNTDLILESASESRAADGSITTAATLNLKQGAVVTDLLKQEGVTYDYNIRTPRGLAGARGTNYTVAVNAAGIETILVSHGTIIFNLLDGRSLSVTAGQIMITDATGGSRSASTLGGLSDSDKAFAQEVAEGTLNALEAALDAGVVINPEAISQALDLFRNFDLDLSATTLETIERLQEKLDELITKIAKEESTIVTEVSPTPPGTLESFTAALSPEQAAAFAEIISLGGFDSADPVFLAKFADPAFTRDLLETVNVYLNLNPLPRTFASRLGILGNANLTAVGADSAGLTRLLNAYAFRNGATPFLADEANFPSSDPALNIAQSEIFFPGTSGNSGTTLFNGSFGDFANPSALYVGATRTFRLTKNNNLNRNPTFNVATGSDVEIRAGEEISLQGLSLSPIAFSSGVRGILMDAITLNLSDIAFPEGSVVSLTSRDGGVTSSFNSSFKIPNFGSSQVGRVNFLGGVYYGTSLLDSDQAFVTGSRGNIGIYSFANGIAPTYPTYIYPPGTLEAFVASLSSTQVTAFDELVLAGGFSKTDTAFRAKFADSTFTGALRNTINLYADLSTADRTTATTLGILGNANFAAVGANSQGLASLLAAYTDLFANAGLGTPAFESEADYTTGSNFGANSNNVFFNGSSGLSGDTLYNGVFGDLVNPGDLTIGATRFFRLSNDASFSSMSANFNVSSGQIAFFTTIIPTDAIPLQATANTGGDVSLYAGDEIELAGLINTPITFSADTRNILMESITINLNNVNFPEGSTAVLVSRDGGNAYTVNSITYTVPNFNSRVIGKVNFLGGVFYGANILDSAQAYVDGSRGNIAIYSFTDGLAHEDPVYTPITLTPEQIYVASLTPQQLAIYNTLPSDTRTGLVTLNDTDLTGVLLGLEPETALPIPAADISRYLGAYTALSPRAQAFFKTLGGATGSGLTNVNGAPDIVRWSSGAIDTAAANYNAFDSTTQNALIALGAGDSIVGLNGDYTAGMVFAISSDIPFVVEAGWGRHLHNLVNDSALSDIKDAARSATPAQRDLVKRLDLDPYSLAGVLAANSGNATPIYARLDLILSQFNNTDFDLLAKVGYNSTFDLFTDLGDSTGATARANLTAIIAHYNGLAPAQQDAARALQMGSILVDNTRAAALADFYIGLSSTEQDALRTTGLFSAFFGPNPNDSATQSNITSALSSYLGLSPTVQNYLLAEAGHDNLLPILTSSATTDKEGRASRSLADIVYILGNVPTSIDTLLDMDVAPAILYSGYLDGASLDENVASLGNAVIFYQSLTPSQQGTLRGLGIMGSGHVGYIGADYSGVNRLLTAYDSLPLALRIDTQRIDETMGNNRSFTGHPSYFLPFNKDTANVGGAMVAVSFGSDGDLVVGAVRRLRINNEGLGLFPETFRNTNFNPFNIMIRAGDLIELNKATFTASARGILMEATTINLANIDFPSGSGVALNSRDGGLYFGIGASVVGGVNFKTGVTYGGSSINSQVNFDNNSQGQVVIGSFANPATPPPPLISGN